MYKHILVQGFYQILVLLLVIFAAPPLIESYMVRSSASSPNCPFARLSSCILGAAVPQGQTSVCQCQAGLADRLLAYVKLAGRC